MGINVLSDDVGFPGVAAAAAAGAVLIATSWLRRLPPRAPLVRYTVRVLLALSLAGAVLAAFGPSWAAPATVAAVVLTATAILILGNAEKAHTLLAGVALIGLGVALIGPQIDLQVEDDALLLRVEFTGDMVAIIGVGVALVGVGIGLMVDSDTLRGVALIVLGVAFTGLGIDLLVEGDALPGVAFILPGVALIGFGTAVLIEGHTSRGVALIVLGVATIGFGIAVLVDGDALPGVAFIVLGVALIGFGTAVLVDSDTLRGVALIVLGVAFTGLGIDLLVEGDALPGVAFIVLGVAFIGFGIGALTKVGAGERLQARFAALVRDPAGQEAPDVENEKPEAANLQADTACPPSAETAARVGQSAAGRP